MDDKIAQLLRATFYFDGELRRYDNKPIGKYLYVMINGKPYNKKKVAWFLQHGVWANCHL